jgi:hypothetical protein
MNRNPAAAPCADKLLSCFKTGRKVFRNDRRYDYGVAAAYSERSEVERVAPNAPAAKIAAAPQGILEGKLLHPALPSGEFYAVPQPDAVLPLCTAATPPPDVTPPQPDVVVPHCDAALPDSNATLLECDAVAPDRYVMLPDCNNLAKNSPRRSKCRTKPTFPPKNAHFQ